MSKLIQILIECGFAEQYRDGLVTKLRNQAGFTVQNLLTEYGFKSREWTDARGRTWTTYECADYSNTVTIRKDKTVNSFSVK